MRVAQYMGFAAFTMLIWDHIDTFADEVSIAIDRGVRPELMRMKVNYIWFGSKGPSTLLNVAGIPAILTFPAVVYLFLLVCPKPRSSFARILT
jgi:Family of unknown function (DUF6533)